MSWEIARSQPEHGVPAALGSLPGGALEGLPGRASVGPLVAGETTVPQLNLTTMVDAGELLLFRSDLRSTLEGVVVCAAGRALATHPEVNVTVAERAGGPLVVPAASALVQLLVLCDDGLRTGTIDAGEARPLAEVRDAVADLVEDLRAGRAPGCSEPATLSVSTFALSGAAPSRAAVPPMSAALAVGKVTRVARTMQVGLSVDARVVDADQAARLLATIVRLLEHPYRRLR